MKASGVYSKFYKVEHLADGEVLTLTINAARLLKMQGQNDKIEINFGESDKSLVLNQTNNDLLVSKLGDETDDWSGAKIRLTRKKLDRPFKGNTHSLTIVAVKPRPEFPGFRLKQPPKGNNVSEVGGAAGYQAGAEEFDDNAHDDAPF